MHILASIARRLLNFKWPNVKVSSRAFMKTFIYPFFFALGIILETSAAVLLQGDGRRRVCYGQ